jgi:CheY-like chemotaxis protein
MPGADKLQKKVLIVEDESIVAYDLEVQLQSAGYQVVGSVDTGAEAVRRALSGDQDLILMDIRLKGDETGIEAARRIQARRKIPVIFISAMTDSWTMEEVGRFPDSAFIRKPFSLTDLKKAIDSL